MEKDRILTMEEKIEITMAAASMAQIWSKTIPEDQFDMGGSWVKVTPQGILDYTRSVIESILETRFLPEEKDEPRMDEALQEAVREDAETDRQRFVEDHRDFGVMETGF